MFRFSSSPIRYPLPVAPTWRGGWGQEAQWDGATWQEGALAIAVGAGRSVEGQLAFSPSGRYVVVGDIWLSDRRSLLTKLRLENPPHLSDVQLVAIAWERLQTSVLAKLVGSFSLAVWDREREVLRHGSGDAEENAGLRLSGGPGSVGVDDGKVARDNQWSARCVGAGGDFDGVDAFQFSAELFAQLAQHTPGGIALEAQKFGSRPDVYHQAGAEKGETFAPCILVHFRGVAHPSLDMARGRFFCHHLKLDLFSSLLKHRADRFEAMIKSYAQWITGPGGEWLKDVGLLVLRVWLGLSMLLLHGWGKVQGMADKAASFPDPLGVGSAMSLNLVVFSEVLCAVLLVAGLAARFALIPLVVTMAVAFFVIHGGRLVGEGNGEMAFIYLAGFVALLIAGPGRYSFDHYILRAFRGNN